MSFGGPHGGHHGGHHGGGGGHHGGGSHSGGYYPFGPYWGASWSPTPSVLIMDKSGEVAAAERQIKQAEVELAKMTDSMNTKKWLFALAGVAIVAWLIVRK